MINGPLYIKYIMNITHLYELYKLKLNINFYIRKELIIMKTNNKKNGTQSDVDTTGNTDTTNNKRIIGNYVYSDSQQQTLYDITHEYINIHSVLPEAQVVTSELLSIIKTMFDARNSLQEPKYYWSIPTELPASVLATILASNGFFARIRTNPNEEPALYVYHDSGYHAGTYQYVDLRSKTGEFNRQVKKYNYCANSRYRNEVLLHLADEAPLVELTTDNRWIPVNNGVFNVLTTEFIPYSSPTYREQFVFLKKVHTDYNENANINPVIIDPSTGESFNVIDIFDSYFGKDTEMTQLLWETFYAVIRYNKNYSTIHFWENVQEEGGNGKGSNGKSTLLALMRNLCGDGTYCSVPIHKLNDRFALANLHDTFALLVDETPLSVPVEKCDILKELATRDASITTEKKFHDTREGTWNGTAIFCSNGYVQLEKSEAAERRFYFWNFTKRFYGNTDRSFIRDVFVKNKDVLEYILYRLLHMGDIDKLCRPKEIDDNLAAYHKATCNTIHEFLNYVALPDESGNIKLQWSIQPFKWLYALYQGWLDIELGQHNKCTPKRFRQELVTWASQHRDLWDVITKDVHRKQGEMEQLEPLIDLYSIPNWHQYPMPNGQGLTSNSLVSTYTGALIKK